MAISVIAPLHSFSKPNFKSIFTVWSLEKKKEERERPTYSTNLQSFSSQRCIDLNFQLIRRQFRKVFYPRKQTRKLANYAERFKCWFNKIRPVAPKQILPTFATWIQLTLVILSPTNNYINHREHLAYLSSTKRRYEIGHARVRFILSFRMLCCSTDSFVCLMSCVFDEKWGTSENEGNKEGEWGEGGENWRPWNSHYISCHVLG